MKKILLFLSLFAMVFASCDNEEVDEIFDQSPEQRVSEQLNVVRADLMSNELGWHSTYTYNEGKETILLLLKFIDETRVEITVPERDNFKKESSYTLNYTQQVDLVFNTHSFLSELVDDGKKADFRWELEKQEDGQYNFNSTAGKTEGKSTLKLEKATPENLEIAFMKSYMRRDANKSFFRNLELASGEKYEYSSVDNKIIFKYVEKEKVVSFESEVNVNNEGFVLTTPFVVDGKSISEFKYDKVTGNFKITNSVDGEIKYSEAPAINVDGVYDSFMTTNFKSIRAYSKSMSGIVPSLKKDISEFSGFQMYVQWGYLLGYAPGHEGGNWAGFSAFAFNKAAEDQTIMSWGMKAYGSWWGEIYGNNEAKLLLAFLTDPAGLYIVNAGNDTYYLISKTDPSMYILMG